MNASRLYTDARQAASESLRLLRWQMLEAGCAFDFRRRAWRCPSCRTHAALRAWPLPDGALALSCASGCAPGAILAAAGMTPFDVAPAAFRVAS